MGYTKGNQSNILNVFEVKIDGQKIAISQITELKLKWSISDFKIIGTLTFFDETSMIEETPIRGGNIVELNMTDFDKVQSTQKMEVVGVEYFRTQTQTYAVTLDLLDIPSSTALGMYKEMSWKEVGIDQIINHKETLKPLMSDKKVDFSKPKNKHENFVVPMSMSFYKLCNWLKEQNNMLFFQDRDYYKLKYFKDLNTKKADPKKYVYKPNNESFRNSIYEMKTFFANKIKADTLQPKAKVYSLDIFKKEPQETKEDYTSIIDKIASKGAKPHSFTNIGEKHYYMSEFHVEEAAEFLYSKNVNKDLILEVLVPGKFGLNIGEIIDLDLVNFFDYKTQEKNISGEWLVHEIVDVINPPDFIQKLTLVRSKFSV